MNNTNDTMTKTVFYTPTPIINLSTNSITDSIIYCGNSTSQNIQISNTGNGDLNFLLSSSSSWLNAVSQNGYNSYTSITQYQNATSHGNNSISVNPNFNSTEKCKLHLSS